MSAIAGGVSTAGRPDAGALVARMLGALVRPAAPGVAVWTAEAGSAALGARVAGAAGSPAGGPAVHVATGCAAVADARLDDPDDLAAVLGQPAGTAAAALVLHAYLAWGTACVERIDGDFAFAVWDPRDRSLFAARDRFGMRPLVYAACGGTAWVGSQPRALLQDPALPRRPDEWRVAEFLNGNVFDGARSFFEDIHRLPPGNALRWSGGTVRTWSYWRPRAPRTPTARSLGEAAEAFRETFDRSVLRRLDTPQTVGAALSGGLDSSSIVTTVRTLRGPDGPPLQTFTAVYPGMPLADERAFSLAVEAGGGLAPHSVAPFAYSPIAEHDADALGIDEPLYMPTWAMEQTVLHVARDAGIGVYLSGHGGDHLLTTGPDGYFGDLLRCGRWVRLAREARSYRGGSAVREALSVAARDAVRAVVPAAVRHLRPPPEPGALAPEFARRLHFAERARALAPPLRNAVDRHVEVLHHPNTHDGLDRMVPATAAIGITFVSPFWDRALAELCLSLPRDVFYRDGVDRVLIREAMAGRLPEAVRHRRSKATFDPLLNLTLLRDGREEIAAMLDGPGLLAEWADLGGLHSSAARLTDRSDDALAQSGSRDARHLLRALTLWLWIRRTRMG